MKTRHASPLVRASALLAAAGLAGCAGVAAPGSSPVVTQEFVSSNYEPSMLGFAQSRGGVALDLAGAPFGQPAALDARVAALLGETHFGPEVDFVPEPGPDFDSIYRVVMVFDAPSASSAPQLCRGPAPELPANAADGLRVMAVYCWGGDRLTSAVASIGPLAGLDDPAFARTIRALGLALFPPASANDERRRDRDWRS
jgi:hypothetical protein